MKTIVSIIVVILTIVSTGCGNSSLLSGEKTPDGANGAGNGSESEDARSALGEYYFILKDEGRWDTWEYWVVDRDGNTVSDDEQFSVLYDTLSGEPQCLLATKDVAIGKNEYGVASSTRSAIFDLDGVLLHDWQERSYMPGFGDYLIRQTDQYDDQGMFIDSECVLWNYKTEEILVENVSWIEKVSEDAALLTDSTGRSSGIMDKSGAKISGFPFPDQYTYANAWNGYLLVSTVDSLGSIDQMHLMTVELESLFSHSSLQGSSVGDVLFYEDGVDENVKTKGIITISGEELYRVPQGESASYFDEDIAVIFSDSSFMYSDLSHRNYRIVDLKTGNVLSEGEGDVVCNTNNNYTNRSEFFLIMKNASIQVVNRDGSTSDEKNVRGAYFAEILDNGFISIMVNGNNNESSSMLVDRELNEIIPVGVYSNIRQVSKWYGNENYYGDALICENYQSDKNRQIIDLRDMEGNILVGGLNMVFDSGPNRIAVRKGFNIGLMDWQGNWIVKRSIFSELKD